VPGLKTHAKISLVIRREAGSLRSYAHFGTGNYHPITARIYTDLSFFTTSHEFTQDAARPFNYITGYAEPERMDALSFSPLTTRQTLLKMIEHEIDLGHAGKPARAWRRDSPGEAPRSAHDYFLTNPSPSGRGSSGHDGHDDGSLNAHHHRQDRVLQD
jgi:Polyphosphate kinase C-terminal domain 1